MKKLVLMAVLGLCATAWGQQSGFGKAIISIPGVTGSLELNVGPAAWESQVRPDGKETQLQAMDRPDHLKVTAFVQRVDFAASPEKCRDEWWTKTEKGDRDRHWKLDNLQKSSQENMARVEFILPEYQGMPVRMKNVHAYMGARNLCAEIHLSKMRFETGDQKLFDDVLATARLRTDESGAPSQAVQPMDYVGQGSRFYLQRNYAAAAELYQKALDMEKQKRTLDQTTFRVLVDNLGMAYGISGNLPKSKEIFEYGITQDPQYPLFYYNLACTYGEMGKMDESLEQLRIAYKYKANIIAGESFPDPMKDDSFRKFVKDKKFVDAVKQMQRQ